MVGDVADFVARQLRVLPAKWFADQAPLLQAILGGFGTAWAAIYTLVQTVLAQTRLSTASGVFVDMISTDYFGIGLSRRAGEADAAFKIRIQQELLRSRGTRLAVLSALTEVTGQSVSIFEPASSSDTGAYNSGGVGYNIAGGWGSLGLPFQSFVRVKRPNGAGIALVAGYGTGGVLAYGSSAMTPMTATDAEIYAAAAAVAPTTYQLWVQILD